MNAALQLQSRGDGNGASVFAALQAVENLAAARAAEMQSSGGRGGGASAMDVCLIRAVAERAISALAVLLRAAISSTNRASNAPYALAVLEGALPRVMDVVCPLLVPPKPRRGSTVAAERARGDAAAHVVGHLVDHLLEPMVCALAPLSTQFALSASAPPVSGRHADPTPTPLFDARPGLVDLVRRVMGTLDDWLGASGDKGAMGAGKAARARLALAVLRELEGLYGRQDPPPPGGSGDAAGASAARAGSAQARSQAHRQGRARAGKAGGEQRRAERAGALARADAVRYLAGILRIVLDGDVARIAVDAVEEERVAPVHATLLARLARVVQAAADKDAGVGDGRGDLTWVARLVAGRDRSRGAHMAEGERRVMLAAIEGALGWAHDDDRDCQS